MLRRTVLLQREQNQKLSPRFVRGESIRQRPPGTATQNSRFGGVTRARPLVLSFPNTKGFSNGFMAFWNLRAARLHAACSTRLAAYRQTPAVTKSPNAASPRSGPSSFSTPIPPGCWNIPTTSRVKCEEALCRHEGPVGLTLAGVTQQFYSACGKPRPAGKNEIRV
jgi:hypothetical protein